MEENEEKKEIIEVQKTQSNETEKNTEVKNKEEVDDRKDRKGLCIASMVLGIVSLVLFCLWYISIPCAILAIIFGIIGAKSQNKAMAITGIVTGAIGAIISVIIIACIIFLGFAIGLTDGQIDKYYDEHYDSSYFN